MTDCTEAVRAGYAASNNLPLPPKARTRKSKESAQEAHEAIRPTHLEQSNAGADDDQTKLYELIWTRAVASQLPDAEYSVNTLDQHTLDVPASPSLAPANENKNITRRELASILHGLRLMQEQWEPQMHGCTSIGLHDPLELSEPNSCNHFCDEEDSLLGPAEIDELCDRLNTGFWNAFCESHPPRCISRNTQYLLAILLDQDWKLLSKARKSFSLTAFWLFV